MPAVPNCCARRAACKCRCGKTTFLNVLAGRAWYGIQSGEIVYNGKEHMPNKVKALMGFVPQDDIVHEDLTVRENIAMAHSLRQSLRDRQEHSSVVSEVLLTASCTLLVYGVLPNMRAAQRFLACGPCSILQ